jgi:diguanylate cyclase (GGDEF)-like protein
MSDKPKNARYSQRANYLDLFNRMSDLVLLIESDQLAVIDANPAAELRLNLSLRELIGRSLLDWVPSELQGDFEKHLRIAKRSYAPKKFRTRWKMAESSLLDLEIIVCWLQVQGAAEDTVLQIIARDITREVEAHEQAERYLKELHTLNLKLEELSLIDEKTQLANFRQFNSQLKVEHERCIRTREPYSVVFCDVDHFKHYNDRNGHPAGDALLAQLARVIQKQCRKSDLAARYGGEEFVVLCRATGKEGALIFAERLREKVATEPFPEGHAQPLGKISISMAVATFSEDGATPEQVVEAADQALYESKRAGRNRVTAAKAKT